MVSLPFHTPFGAKYISVSRFFLHFAYTYMGMAALGLSTEAMGTTMTPRPMVFCLNPLIINNVAFVGLSPDLLPTFY